MVEWLPHPVRKNIKIKNVFCIKKGEIFMILREKINEVLKNENNTSNNFSIQEIINMIYVIYKDIEKIKNHLEIE